MKPRSHAPRPAGTVTMVRPRITFGDGLSVGPGKADLLRAIAQAGSIAGAARALGMTYKRAWLLVATLNAGFCQPLVSRAVGGRGGGGARLTELGEAVLRSYAKVERACQKAAATELLVISRLRRR